MLLQQCIIIHLCEDKDYYRPKSSGVELSTENPYLTTRFKKNVYYISMAFSN